MHRNPTFVSRKPIRIQPKKQKIRNEVPWRVNSNHKLLKLFISSERIRPTIHFQNEKTKEIQRLEMNQAKVSKRWVYAEFPTKIVSFLLIFSQFLAVSFGKRREALWVCVFGVGWVSGGS